MATDRTFIDAILTAPHDRLNRDAYHDWLKDHGQDSLAEVLASLDGLIRAALEKHLTMTIFPRKEYLGSSQVVVGWTVSVEWDGCPLPGMTRAIDLH